MVMFENSSLDQLNDAIDHLEGIITSGATSTSYHGGASIVTASGAQIYVVCQLKAAKGLIDGKDYKTGTRPRTVEIVPDLRLRRPGRPRPRHARPATEVGHGRRPQEIAVRASPPSSRRPG